MAVEERIEATYESVWALDITPTENGKWTVKTIGGRPRMGDSHMVDYILLEENLRKLEIMSTLVTRGNVKPVNIDWTGRKTIYYVKERSIGGKPITAIYDQNTLPDYLGGPNPLTVARTARRPLFRRRRR